MKNLKRLDSILFAIEKWACMFGFVGMVATVLYSIVRREMIHVPFSAGEELTRNLTVIVIFISAAMAVKCQTHVGVEVFTNLVPERFKKQAWYLKNIVELILWVFALFFAVQVMNHYMGSGQVTPIARIPMWVMYSCVPICGVLGVYHMIVRILSEREGDM